MIEQQNMMQDSGFLIPDGKNRAYTSADKSGIRHRASSEIRAGDFVHVKITEALDYDLKGTIIL